MKKLLGIVVLGLLFGGSAYSNITVLNCKNDLSHYRYFYIDTNKKYVGLMYLYKKENNYFIYDWWYKNIQFNENTISMNNPSALFGEYKPDIAWNNLIELDRANLKIRFYSKSKAVNRLKQNYKYLPDFLIKFIGKNVFSWELITTEKCKIISTPKNIKFISKTELDILFENLKPKAKF